VNGFLEPGSGNINLNLEIKAFKMSNIELLSNIPFIGWITILILGLLTLSLIFFLILKLLDLLKNKTLKTKFFDIENATKVEIQKKQLYINEGKDELENQCQAAQHILKELRIKCYNTALELFDFKEPKDLIILELITYRLTDRLYHDVKNDLLRNHISKKNNQELETYIKAKSRGYHYVIVDFFYMFNRNLPYHLPLIMTKITYNDIESIFRDIYYSARGIVGCTLEN
jgi:hypothetical protein